MKRKLSPMPMQSSTVFGDNIIVFPQARKSVLEPGTKLEHLAVNFPAFTHNTVVFSFNYCDERRMVMLSRLYAHCTTLHSYINSPKHYHPVICGVRRFGRARCKKSMNDSIKDYCKKKGFADFVVEGGLDYLVPIPTGISIRISVCLWFGVMITPG